MREPPTEPNTISPELADGSASTHTGPSHVPLVKLNRDGTIDHMTDPARRTLGYASGAEVEPSFFSHVHGHNLRRVMHDLALMVSHRKQRAKWLLRLRTGNGRWRWFRAVARNHLDRPDGTVRMQFRPI